MTSSTRRTTRILCLPIFATAVGFFALLYANLPPASAQTATMTVPQQVANAFSSVGEVKQLSLTGTVSRYFDSFADTGSLSLSALDDGSGTLSMHLQSHGPYQESADPASLGRSCTWQGSDGTSHAMDYSSCAIPLLWFMPNMALQAGTANTVVSDQGNGQLAGLQVRMLTVTNSTDGWSSIATASNSVAVRIGVDPSSLLPMVMEYTVHPDNNAMAIVKVDIMYSDWGKEQGVEIPHSIQRRLNGALETDIRIQNVSLN